MGAAWYLGCGMYSFILGHTGIYGGHFHLILLLDSEAVAKSDQLVWICTPCGTISAPLPGPRLPESSMEMIRLLITD